MEEELKQKQSKNEEEVERLSQEGGEISRGDVYYGRLLSALENLNKVVKILEQIRNKI